MEQGEGTSADAEPAPKVASRIRAHRWASNVTSEEVNEAIFVLRQERIPDRILVEALELAEAFPSKWKTQARKLHTERTPARVERPWCESCGFSGMVLNEQNLAEPCPDCRPLPSLELVAEA